MIKEDKVYLKHILESIGFIKAYLKNLEEKFFYKSVSVQDAVIRRIEIIGEAARKISPEFKAAHPKIAWPEMIGMRNFLIHEYFNVDLKLAWKTAQEDIPALEKAIKKSMKD